MPSGFIELTNTDIFSIRWTGYDEIIKITLKELENLESPKTNSLVSLLKTHIPPADFNERHEMKWGFIDERVHTTVCRKLELYNLCDESLNLFWAALERGYYKLLEKGMEYSDLQAEFLMELISLKNKSQRSVVLN